MSHTGAVNLDGLIAREEKSSDALSPLFEALTNAIESIEIREEEYKDVSSFDITINFYFEGLMKANQPDRLLEKIEIIDNGIGFNTKEFSRFDEFFNRSKSRNNKGSGRLQYIKFFKNTHIESVYKDDKFMFRSFDYADKYIDNKFIGNQLDPQEVKEKESYTKIIFSGFKDVKDKLFYEKKDIFDLKEKILINYIIKLSLMEKPFNIRINYIDANDTFSQEITKADIPTDSKEVIIDIPRSRVVCSKEGNVELVQSEKVDKIHVKNFKMPSSKLKKNEIAFYSKNIKVSELKIESLKKATVIEGNRNITGIFGDVFDDERYINETRNEFKIPTKEEFLKRIKETGVVTSMLNEEDNDVILFDDISNLVKKEICEFYPELFKRQIEINNEVSELAELFHFSDEVVKETNIDVDDNKEGILKKLYRTENDKTAKDDAKLKEIMDSVSALNPLDESYKKEIEEKSRQIISIIPDQNKRALSKYVARREIVSRLLELIIQKDTELQRDWEKNPEKYSRKEREALIHDLIFPRKEDTSALNDLWILNEEFVHFQGASDNKLTEIEFAGKRLLRSGISEEEISKKYQLENQGESRPDILLFPQENKIIIIEFKNEDVELTDYLSQIPKYAKLIANCISSYFKVKQFYGFLIGEKINQYAMPGHFIRTFSSTDNMWFDPNHPIKDIESDEIKASLYYEVIKLSELAKRAELRNKSFAEKLGIRKDFSKNEEDK